MPRDIVNWIMVTFSTSIWKAFCKYHHIKMWIYSLNWQCNLAENKFCSSCLLMKLVFIEMNCPSRNPPKSFTFWTSTLDVDENPVHALFRLGLHLSFISGLVYWCYLPWLAGYLQDLSHLEMPGVKPGIFYMQGRCSIRELWLWLQSMSYNPMYIHSKVSLSAQFYAGLACCLEHLAICGRAQA